MHRVPAVQRRRPVARVHAPHAHDDGRFLEIDDSDVTHPLDPEVEGGLPRGAREDGQLACSSGAV